MTAVFYGDLDDPHNIRVSDKLIWAPHHGWDDDTDQIDAQLVTTGRVVVGQLDIWATDAPENADSVDAELSAAAHATWSKDSVLIGHPDQFSVTALLVPGTRLTRALVHEAIARFHP